MERKIFFGVMALIAVLVAVPFVLSSESTKLNYTEKESKEIALEFIESSETYKFDGFELEHKETLYPDIADCESCYTSVLEFKSEHAGYVDRTGKMLAQVITSHEAHITIEEGEVTSAVLDEDWDMIKQEKID